MITISKHYKALCTQHHINRHDWGRSGIKWFGLVSILCEGNEIKTILDYGCGKAVLSDALTKKYKITKYEPAIPKLEKKPDGKFDMVLCTDVLEHVEEIYIDNILKELQQYIKVMGFFTICLGHVKKHLLPDGSPVHILVKPKVWWREKLDKYFTYTEIYGRGRNKREMVLLIEVKDEK